MYSVARFKKLNIYFQYLKVLSVSLCDHDFPSSPVSPPSDVTTILKFGVIIALFFSTVLLTKCIPKQHIV